jgi:hypothetical protein
VAGAPDSGSCLDLAAASRSLLGSEDWIGGCVLLIYLTVRGLVSGTTLSGLLRGLFLAVLCCHLGARSRTPERRLWKVDCTGVLTASGVAVVMAHSFGHAGGEGLASGVPGVGGASARSAPRSCVGSSARGQVVARGTKCGEGFSGRKLSASAPMTSTPAGCRDPLEGVIVATLSILGLRVKTLDFGLDDGGVLLRRYPLGGVVVELGFPWSRRCLRWQARCFLVFLVYF